MGLALCAQRSSITVQFHAIAHSGPPAQQCVADAHSTAGSAYARAETAYRVYAGGGYVVVAA